MMAKVITHTSTDFQTNMGPDTKVALDLKMKKKIQHILVHLGTQYAIRNTL